MFYINNYIPYSSSQSQRLIDQANKRLNTGLKINSASENAAGLAVSNRLTSKINELKIKLDGIDHSLSKYSTKNNALTTTDGILRQIKDLINQSNSTTDSGIKSSIQTQINNLLKNVNDIGNNTTFEGEKLFTEGVLTFDKSSGSTGGVVGIPSSQELKLDKNLTIEMDYFLDENTTEFAMHLLNSWGDSGTSTANFVLYLFGTDNGSNPSKAGTIQLYGNADGTFQKTSGSTKLSTGQWYHIAIEYDYQKGGQLYVDGDAVGARVGSGLLKTNDDELYLYSPEASMDNVRIYNRSLTQSEINNNMNGQVTNNGLVGEWLFDDPSTSSTFKDTSGNNNDAVKYSMTGSTSQLTDFLKITNLNAQDPNALKNIERAISLNSNEQAKVQKDMDVLNTESSYWNKNLKNYQTAYSRIMTDDEAKTSSLLAQEQLKQQHYSEILQRQKTQSQTLYSILFG
ncbi:hypothetical protein P4679_23015 [Priestia megaterium]|uniref:flagellin n=1 Tax=Priestia megaterium TaxID=1404 RepID=UPI002E215183|nr:hypothetical protein [Priestia megaterium]